MTRDKGNMGYLMYLADSVGYLGYVAVMLVKNFAAPKGEFLEFFRVTSWVIALACLAMLVPAMIYFWRHPATQVTGEPRATLTPAEAHA